MHVKFVDRTAPCIRLGLFLTVPVALAAALALRSVHADTAEASWAPSAEPMAYPGVAASAVRALQLNGARVSFRTQTIAAPLDEVLAHYESVCAGPHAGFIEQLSIQAARNAADGYVACLDMGDGPRDMRSLSERLVRFSETGDLAALGGLRYARAHRIPKGSGEQTFLLTMWADSAFNLFGMLPTAGADAGGSDLLGVPRPAGSQRILSAWEAEQPSGVVVYRVRDRSVAQLESFYRIELPKQGWALIERHPSESIAIDGIHMLSAEQGNRMVTVLASPSGASETVLSILSSEAS